jgi:chromosomal replication initiation ATPase DnaA
MDGLGSWATMPILDLLEPSSGVRLKTKPFTSVGQIKRAVAKRYNVTTADLEGPCRKIRFARPRQIAMALAYRRLRRYGYSLPLIGRHFGGRDHTTVLFAAKKYGHAVSEKRRRGPHHVQARQLQARAA